jgi:hypothetical protein
MQAYLQLDGYATWSCWCLPVSPTHTLYNRNSRTQSRREKTEILGILLEKLLQRWQIQIFRSINVDPTRRSHIVPEQVRTQHLEWKHTNL